MGFSHSWIAVKGLDRATALTALRLEAEQGESDDLPRLGLGALANDWLLIVAAEDEALQDRMTALAAYGPAVACFVEEHVMYSEARGYRDGVEAWRVVHDAENGLFHLEVTGEPPAALENLRSEAAANRGAEGGKSAGVDIIFDVPPALAKTICGFKLDDRWPDGLAFVELRRPRKSGPGWSDFFQRLFGGA